MQNGICEGHLTYHWSAPRSVLRDVGKRYGFHFSWIDGWDELGEGRHMFLTSHGDFHDLDWRMNRVMNELEALDILCIRKKIEITITDQRFPLDA